MVLTLHRSDFPAFLFGEKASVFLTCGFMKLCSTYCVESIQDGLQSVLSLGEPVEDIVFRC